MGTPPAKATVTESRAGRAASMAKTRAKKQALVAVVPAQPKRIATIAKVALIDKITEQIDQHLLHYSQTSPSLVR
jgi:hypothetical protein